jgi:hypothetical protein
MMYPETSPSMELELQVQEPDIPLAVPLPSEGGTDDFQSFF